MHYFSVELCKKLQEKGLVNESNTYWKNLRTHDGYEKLYSIIDEYEAEVISMSPDFTTYPAFIFQDLLTKDNAVRLWGEEIEETGLIEDFYQESEMSERQITYQELPKYQTKSYELLDLYQQSGLEAVEKYVMENL